MILFVENWHTKSQGYSIRRKLGWFYFINLAIGKATCADNVTLVVLE